MGQIDIEHIKSVAYVGLLLWFIIFILYISGTFINRYKNSITNTYNTTKLKNNLNSLNKLIIAIQCVLIFDSTSFILRFFLTGYKVPIESIWHTICLIIPSYFIILSISRLFRLLLKKAKNQDDIDQY
jgi:hypothetical protein